MRKTDFRPLTSEERIPSFPMLAKGHRRMDAHPHVEHRLPSEIRSTCGAHNKHQHGMIDWVPWARIEMAQVCTIKKDDPQRYSAHIISYDHMCGQNTGPVLMSTYMQTYVQNSLQTNSHRMFSICGKCLAPSSLSWLRSCRKLKGSKRSAATLGWSFWCPVPMFFGGFFF